MTKELTVNGYRILHHKTENPIISIRFLFNVGSSNEEIQGTAHFLEHMFFKGTLKKDYKEINKIFSRLGSVNAYTYYDRTVYYVDCLEENFGPVVDILLEMLNEPRFDKNEFEKERGVILEEVQSGLDDPMTFFWNKAIPSIFGDPAHPVPGTIESVKKITIQDLKILKSLFYNCVTPIIVGNIDEDKIIKKFSSILSNGIRPIQSRLYSLNLENYSFKHNSDQAIIGIVMEGLSGKDLIGNPVSGVLHNALSGGMHSILFDRIREEMGLCYSIFSHELPFKDIGATYIVCLLSEENIKKVEAEILKIIKNIKKKGISKELLEISKLNYIFNIADRLQTSDSYASAMLDSYYVCDQKITSFEKEKEMTLKVKNKDIIEFANEYYKNYKFIEMTKEK
jgi:predicted Zn-dependent peptidase